MEEFKQLTLDDLFKHSAELDHARMMAQKNKLNIGILFVLMQIECRLASMNNYMFCVLFFPLE